MATILGIIVFIAGYKLAFGNNKKDSSLFDTCLGATLMLMSFVIPGTFSDEKAGSLVNFLVSSWLVAIGCLVFVVVFLFIFLVIARLRRY